LASLRGGVGVHLALAAGHDDVYEAAGVGDALLRAALGDLLLLLLLDLWVRNAALADGVLGRCRALVSDGGWRRGARWCLSVGWRERFLLRSREGGYRTLGVCDLTLPARASEP
jgi:hypothetical protein